LDDPFVVVDEFVNKIDLFGHPEVLLLEVGLLNLV